MVNKWSAFLCALVMLLGTLGGVAVAEEKTQQLDIRGSVVYDLEEVSIIDQVSVKSKAQGCDLYLSYSGETYQLIEHLENKNDTFLFELNRQERAQFVKLKFSNKDESAYTGEFDVEISSTPADKEEKIQDISYSWSKSSRLSQSLTSQRQIRTTRRSPMAVWTQFALRTIRMPRQFWI